MTSFYYHHLGGRDGYFKDAERLIYELNVFLFNSLYPKQYLLSSPFSIYCFYYIFGFLISDCGILLPQPSNSET
jgi:hypothetical protein